MIVVDASVAVKWLVPEAGSASARELLQDGTPLFAPALIRVEVAAAIARKVRSEEIDRRDGEGAVSLWLQFLVTGLVTLVPDEADVASAWQLSIELKHPLQDCLYLALSLRLRVPLVTADRKFVDRARPEYSEIRLLGSD